MEYKAGEIIYDSEGSEWMITKTWDHEQYLCLGLIGVSGSAAGQMGGYRVEFEDGGLTVNVR